MDVAPRQEGGYSDADPLTSPREHRMLDSFVWPEPEGVPDERLLRNVREQGCHLMGIAAEAQAPAYVFSIGLYLNYAQAELVMFGLDPKDACAVINALRDRAAAGRRYVAGDVCDDLPLERKVCFVEVPLRAYDTYLGTAIWFYAKLPQPFPCLQVVWPDQEGRFPWEPGCDARLKDYQPMLRPLS